MAINSTKKHGAGNVGRECWKGAVIVILNRVEKEGPLVTSERRAEGGELVSQEASDLTTECFESSGRASTGGGVDAAECVMPTQVGDKKVSVLVLL